MINGIIKLFYSEIVKTKMKTMSSGDYELNDKCQEFRNITLKIDSLFFKLIKFMFGVMILILAFNINTLFGVGTFLIEIAYIFYKRNMEAQIKERIETIKNNMETPKVNFISENGKAGINLLITLLLIGLITSFNVSIVVCFIVVFLFTMKDIYSNIK